MKHVSCKLGRVDPRRRTKLLVGSPTRLDVACWFEMHQHGLYFSAGSITKGIGSQRTAVGQALDDLLEAGLLRARRGPRGWLEYRRLDSPLWAPLAALAAAIRVASAGDGDSGDADVNATLVPLP
jgi:DNA-binding transcriptional ArsR family regulator